jgi:hypothetical protein
MVLDEDTESVPASAQAPGTAPVLERARDKVLVLVPDKVQDRARKVRESAHPLGSVARPWVDNTEPMGKVDRPDMADTVGTEDKADTEGTAGKGDRVGNKV